MNQFARRLRRAWPILLVCALLGGMLWARPVVSPAQAQAGPTVIVNPTSGPPGRVVAISAVGFPLTDVGHTANIFFDSTLLGGYTFVRCDGGLSAGFGSNCSGPTQTVAVPSNATQGNHTFTVNDGIIPASTGFTVQGQAPTATPTSTPITPTTPFPVGTSTATALPKGTLTATPTTTPLPVPSPPGNTDTPTPQPTIIFPRDTPTATPTATVTQSSSGLPTAPACTAAGSPTSGSTGGGTLGLRATGLPANATVNLFYDGPLQSVHGTSNRPVTQSVGLGQATAGSDGTLNVSVQLPGNTGTGIAHILVFQTDTNRTQPLNTWDVQVSPRSAQLHLTGMPGDQVVITPGDSAATATGACSATLGSGGTADVLVQPGDNTVSFLAPDRSVVSSGVATSPGAVTAFDLPANEPQGAPAISGCPADLRIFTVFDLYSGTDAALGGGTFGYFLSGVPLNDSVLVDVYSPSATAAGQTLDPSCVPQVTGTLSGTNPSTGTQTLVSSLASGAPVTGAAYAALVQQATNALGLNQPPTLAIAGSLRFVLSHFNPGALVPGTGTLRINAGGITRDVGVQTVESNWTGSPIFRQDAEPTFDTSTRTYRISGHIPPDSPEANLDITGAGGTAAVGWGDFVVDGKIVVAAKTLQETNRARASVHLDERFNTQGTWAGSSGTMTLDLTMLGHTTINHATYPLNVRLLGLQHPEYDARLMLPTGGPDPVLDHLSVPVAGIKLPLVDRTYPLSIEGDATATSNARVDARISNGLSQFDFTVAGAARATLNTTPFPPSQIAHLDAGIALDTTLQASLIYTAGGFSGRACSRGPIDFHASYAFSDWKAEGQSSAVYGPARLADVNAGSCPAVTLTPPNAPTPATSATVASHPANPAISFDGQGRGMAIWVRADATAKKDTLFAAPARGSGWGKPVRLTVSANAILDPRIAELGDGRVMASWIQNTLTDDEASKLSQPLGVSGVDTILRRQEVSWAIFANGRWSSPRRLTSDKVVDDHPTLAADTTRHSALIVWSRNDIGKSNSLEASVFLGSSWSRPVVVPGTSNVFARQPSVTARPGSGFALAWIGGPYNQGTIHVVGFRGEKSTPTLPGNPSDVTIAPDGNGVAIAAAMLPRRGKALAVGEPAIVAATNFNGTWKSARVAPLGDSPRLAASPNGLPVLTFTVPLQTASAARVSQIDYAVALSAGGFSPVGQITRDANQYSGAAMGIDPSTGVARLLYQSQPLQDGVVQQTALWKFALAPASTVLDDMANLQAAHLPLKGKLVADLASAHLSTAHPAPGDQVRITVPLHNLGLSAVRASGTIKILSGGQVLATLRPRASIAPNATFSSTAHFAVRNRDITLQAQGMGTISNVVLGGPAAPTNVAVARNASGNPMIRWTASTDTGPLEYRVYRVNGSTFTLVGIAHDTIFTDSGTTSDTAAYAVSAVDQQGRESALSRTASQVGVSSAHAMDQVATRLLLQLLPDSGLWKATSTGSGMPL